LIHEKRGVV